MKNMILSLAWSLGALIQCAAYELEALKADMAFFTDSSCSQLKAEVKLNDQARFKSELLQTIAVEMLNGKYDRTYWAAAYEAYPSPRALAKNLKLGDGFSRYRRPLSHRQSEWLF